MERRPGITNDRFSRTVLSDETRVALQRLGAPCEDCRIGIPSRRAVVVVDHRALCSDCRDARRFDRIAGLVRRMRGLR